MQDEFVPICKLMVHRMKKKREDKNVIFLTRWIFFIVGNSLLKF